jgi:hypothetical protein
MHRDDVCQAIGRSFDAGPYAEEIVAQVMYDVDAGPFWGDRPAVDVELTGDPVAAEAVATCRMPF